MLLDGDLQQLPAARDVQLVVREFVSNDSLALLIASYAFPRVPCADPIASDRRYGSGSGSQYVWRTKPGTRHRINVCGDVPVRLAIGDLVRARHPVSKFKARLLAMLSALRTC